MLLTGTFTATSCYFEVFKQNMKLVKSYNFIVAFPRPAVQETRHNSVIIICPKDWSHVILMNSLNSYRPQRSWGKVMFLQASVILLTGGVCYPSMHGRWYPSMPCSRSPGGSVPGGGLLWGMHGPGGYAPGGAWSRWGGLCGLLLWPSVVVFCYALLLRPSGLVAF